MDLAIYTFGVYFLFKDTRNLLDGDFCIRFRIDSFSNLSDIQFEYVKLRFPELFKVIIPFTSPYDPWPNNRTILYLSPTSQFRKLANEPLPRAIGDGVDAAERVVLPEASEDASDPRCPIVSAPGSPFLSVDPLTV